MKISEFVMKSDVEENGAGGYIIGLKQKYMNEFPELDCIWIEFDSEFEPAAVLKWIPKQTDDILVSRDLLTEEDIKFIGKVVSYYAEN